jgi:hypothetical protein
MEGQVSSRFLTTPPFSPPGAALGAESSGYSYPPTSVSSVRSVLPRPHRDCLFSDRDPPTSRNATDVPFMHMHLRHHAHAHAPAPAHDNSINPVRSSSLRVNGVPVTANREPRLCFHRSPSGWQLRQPPLAHSNNNDEQFSDWESTFNALSRFRSVRPEPESTQTAPQEPIDGRRYAHQR